MCLFIVFLPFELFLPFQSRVAQEANCTAVVLGFPFIIIPGNFLASFWEPCVLGFRVLFFSVIWYSTSTKSFPRKGVKEIFFFLNLANLNILLFDHLT